MNAFLQRCGESVTGVLSGFDRFVLHGSLRLFSYPAGLLKYLCHHRILLKDFGKHSQALSDRVIEQSLAPVTAAGRPVIYLRSSQDRKEDLARDIAARDGIQEGPICVLKVVEPCRSFEVARNHQTHRIELRSRPRKCLHLYHYMIHPTFGFMHVRLQTWYPFQLQLCLNGREWLSRQLDAAQIGYQRERNCFVQIDDLEAAQHLMDQQIKAPWRSLLEALERQVNPVASEFVIRGPGEQTQPVRYYWSTPQTEWASDVMFRSREELVSLYERLIHYGVITYGPGDVLRFFGHRVKRDGRPWSNFPGELTSDVKTRSEGVRIKYRCRGNSLKMYDKGSVLRFEMTMNEPKDFRVLRQPEGDAEIPARWMPLRHGLADLGRRAQVSQAANERLMQAQAAVQSPQRLQELASKICQRVTVPAHTQSNGRRVGAIARCSPYQMLMRNSSPPSVDRNSVRTEFGTGISVRCCSPPPVTRPSSVDTPPPSPVVLPCCELTDYCERCPTPTGMSSRNPVALRSPHSWLLATPMSQNSLTSPLKFLFTKQDLRR